MRRVFRCRQKPHIGAENDVLQPFDFFLPFGSGQQVIPDQADNAGL
jgi:hypothetical protein